MMKIKIVYLLTACLSMLFSCEEVERGPLTIDVTTPGIVTEVVTTSLPGGAKITYKVPDDNDVMLIEASFKRNGQRVTAKSSVYNNFVIIEGLRSVEPQDVALVTVDKSNNRSAAVSVTITPGEAPIDKLVKSFVLSANFGGPRLDFDNSDNLTAEVLLYEFDQDGKGIFKQSLFIDDNSKSFHIFRGSDPGIITFGLVVQDRWNNATDTLKAEITVFEEVLLDKSKFKNLGFATDGPAAYGGSVEGLWDGNYSNVTSGGYHSDVDNILFKIPPNTDEYLFISIDMGVLAKLSRMKFFLRAGADRCCNTPYGHGDPRYYEVWGTDKLPEGDPDGESLEGWTRLIENGEVIKPSGLPLGQHSNEDLAKAASGEDVDFDLHLSPVRYIRFACGKNWNGGDFIHMTEMEFFGELQE